MTYRPSACSMYALVTVVCTYCYCGVHQELQTLFSYTGVPEYMCEKATNVAQSQQSSSVGQGSTNPDSGGQKLAAIPSTIKDNLLKMIDSQFSEPAAGGRPASLLGSIQKLLSSYASGGGSITKKSVDSPQPSSVSNTRRSSLTELLRSEGSSGKGSVDQQASEATKDDKEIVAGKGSSEKEMINKPDSNVLKAESEGKIDDKKSEKTEIFEKSDVSVTPVLRSKVPAILSSTFSFLDHYIYIYTHMYRKPM